MAGLGPPGVVVNAGNASSKLLPATVVSPAPDQALWNRLFAATTPVDAYKPDAPILTSTGDGSRAIAPAGALRLETSHAHGAAARALADLYAEALRSSPTEALKPDHPVAQAIAGWGPGRRPRWRQPPRRAGRPGGGTVSPIEAGARVVQQPQVSGLLDPGSLTTAKVEQAAALLRQQGQPGAAAAAPGPGAAPPAPLREAPAPAASRSNGSTNGTTNGAVGRAATRGTGGTGTPGALQGPGDSAQPAGQHPAGGAGRLPPGWWGSCSTTPPCPCAWDCGST